MAVQVGDLDIAGNYLKISAWLATMATAGLYFCFSGHGSQYIFISSKLPLPLFYPYTAISFLFGFSLIAAYKFHKSYNYFCALSKNAICAYKLQQSIAMQEIEHPELLKALDKNDQHFWEVVQTGELWGLFSHEHEQIIKDFLDRIEVSRSKIEYFSKFQRKSTLIGFLLLILCNAFFSLTT